MRCMVHNLLALTLRSSLNILFGGKGGGGGGVEGSAKESQGNQRPYSTTFISARDGSYLVVHCKSYHISAPPSNSKLSPVITVTHELNK